MEILVNGERGGDNDVTDGDPYKCLYAHLCNSFLFTASCSTVPCERLLCAYEVGETRMGGRQSAYEGPTSLNGFGAQVWWSWKWWS